MKNLHRKAFTLVELLVVITIIAILAVVGAQSFGGATSKAQNVVKKTNITNLANTLNLFSTEEKHYPMPQAYSGTTNLWGYKSSEVASTSNKIKVVYNDQEINNIVVGSTLGGGKIMEVVSTGSPVNQIGAKGVLGRNGSFNKRYLKDELYDTQLGDIKLTGEADKKMIDYGIGKFVYAVYARGSKPDNWNNSGNRGKYFELATTIEDPASEGYTTLMVGNYSKDEFETNINAYPESLIGLKNEEKDKNVATTEGNQGIPYPISNFAK